MGEEKKSVLEIFDPASGKYIPIQGCKLRLGPPPLEYWNVEHSTVKEFRRGDFGLEVDYGFSCRFRVLRVRRAGDKAFAYVAPLDGGNRYLLMQTDKFEHYGPDVYKKVAA